MDFPVDFEAFKAALNDPAPPEGAGLALQALWHQYKGDWKTAHRLAQREKSPAGAWVHAHLHRAEGDQGNAAYWYRRADKTPATGALEAEWEAIARALCGG